MYLVQILLPLHDNREKPFPRSYYRTLRDSLTERFGGLTAYARAPAEGLWDSGDESWEHDDIIIYEVMVAELDRAWWAEFRAAIEKKFEQDELVIRAHSIEKL
jgi:hypothetical protein